jgi:hypothetical protein
LYGWAENRRLDFSHFPRQAKLEEDVIFLRRRA